MFASKTTGTVTLDGVIVTIQKLSGRALEDAAKVKHDEAMVLALRLNAALSAPGVAEAVQARAERQAEAPAVVVDADRQRQQRYGKYDRPTVLRAGVRSWKAAEPLPSLATGIDDLDEDAAEQLHRAILDLTLPSIDPAVVETDRKNG